MSPVVVPMRGDARYKDCKSVEECVALFLQDWREIPQHFRSNHNLSTMIGALAKAIVKLCKGA